jgi:hypothetical protein
MKVFKVLWQKLGHTSKLPKDEERIPASRTSMCGLQMRSVDEDGEVEMFMEIEVDDVTYEGTCFISWEMWEAMTDHFMDGLKRQGRWGSQGIYR